MSKNSMTLGQCILNCDDDGDCESSCVRNFKEGHAECPCQVSHKDEITIVNVTNLILTRLIVHKDVHAKIINATTQIKRQS